MSKWGQLAKVSSFWRFQALPLMWPPLLKGLPNFYKSRLTRFTHLVKNVCFKLKVSENWTLLHPWRYLWVILRWNLYRRPCAAWEIACKWKKIQLLVRQISISLPSSISNVTDNKNELWKTFKLQKGLKAQLQSVSFFFKFVNPLLLTHLLCYEQLFFLFHSVWWQALFAWILIYFVIQLL